MRRLVLYLVAPPILILFVAQLTVLGGMNLIHQEGYPDPFAPFESMMPGQWAVALGDHLCDLQTTYRFGEMLDCEIHLGYEPIVTVTSTFFNDRIVQTSFGVHDLYVGDIVRHWGRPDVVVRYNHQFFVLWKDQGLIGFIAPVGPAGQFNYTQQVERFSIGLESRNLP